MKKQAFEAGFSLLEVLLALSLFAFVCFSLAQIELKSLSVTKQAERQQIAQRQLHNFSSLAEADIIDRSRWQRNNAALLPHALSTLKAEGDERCASISWRSGSGVWHCPQKRKKGYTCLSIITHA